MARKLTDSRLYIRLIPDTMADKYNITIYITIAINQDHSLSTCQMTVVPRSMALIRISVLWFVITFLDLEIYGKPAQHIPLK